jgi:hypothetical protein
MPWWRKFPSTLPDPPLYTPPAGLEPVYSVGELVRLVDKPDRVRQVLGIVWHAHCREYAYVIETSAPQAFRPYWFASQLTPASR